MIPVSVSLNDFNYIVSAFRVSVVVIVNNRIYNFPTPIMESSFACFKFFHFRAFRPNQPIMQFTFGFFLSFCLSKLKRRFF